MSRQVTGQKAQIGWFLLALSQVAEHKYLARRAAMQAAKGGVQETLEVSELEVLKEIRDVLVSQRSGPAGEGRGPEPGRGHDE